MSNSPLGDWYQKRIPTGIKLDAPGIYEWRIAGLGVYVGKSRRLRRRLREYPNNVRKLLSKLPYRKGKPNDFRLVHRVLAQAHAGKLAVTFGVLEDCDFAGLSARERFWIGERRAESKLTGLPVLNED